MKKYLLLLILATSFLFFKNDTGIFKYSTDIGNPKIKGATYYDKNTKVYTLEGGGYNIWFNRDEFHYAYNKLKGDFTLTAHFTFAGKGTEAHRKTGWMVRESTADTAVHISAVLHGDGLTVLQWRVKPGMNMRDPEDEIRADREGIASFNCSEKGINLLCALPKKKVLLLSLLENTTCPTCLMKY